MVLQGGLKEYLFGAVLLVSGLVATGCAFMTVTSHIVHGKP